MIKIPRRAIPPLIPKGGIVLFNTKIANWIFAINMHDTTDTPKVLFVMPCIAFPGLNSIPVPNSIARKMPTTEQLWVQLKMYTVHKDFVQAYCGKADKTVLNQILSFKKGAEGNETHPTILRYLKAMDELSKTTFERLK